MYPIIKLHSIVLGLTTLIVFYLWEIVSSLAIKYPDLKIPVAAIISIGLYQTILTIIKFVFMRIRFIKKLIFGSSYLEGIWIGFFIGKSDKERFFIETFEQDFNSITIRGQGYRDSEGYYGSWTSQNVHFDVRKGSISYMYETDAIKNSFINPGLAIFTIDRKSINSPPHRLKGFSSDLYHPKKLKSLERKISDVPDVKDVNFALQQAKLFYEENKSFIEMI
jgi:hypothetical protein